MGHYFNSEQTGTIASVTAANVPPIIKGTYTFAAGVCTLTITQGAAAQLTTGDIFYDSTNGNSGYISAVNQGTPSVTVPNLSSVFAGGGNAFEIHRSPVNMLAVSPPCHPVGLMEPNELIDLDASIMGLTSYVVQFYQWSVLKHRWHAQGGGTMTVSAVGQYTIPIYGANRAAKNKIASGSAFTYTTATGAVSSITWDAGYSIYNARAGMYWAPLDSENRAIGADDSRIIAVDNPNAIVYVASGLGTIATGNFILQPLQQPYDVPHIYPWFSTVTGTGVASVEFRLQAEH